MFETTASHWYDQRMVSCIERAEYAVIDTETTGLDGSVDKIVEVGAVRFRDGVEIARFETLVNPGIPIPPGASAVHHITDEDVVGKPSPEQAYAQLFEFVAGCAMLVAHNAPFDSSFLPNLADRRWLCSFRLARHVWPDAPGYSNQALRYYLEALRKPFEERFAHGAIVDAEVTAAVYWCSLQRYLELGNPDELGALFSFVARPLQVPRVPFGKHKGAEWASVPADYLQWAITKAEVLRDPDWRAAFEAELARRPAAEPTMPFGAHRDKPLSDIPADYLEWALAKANRVRDDERLRTSLEDELTRRRVQ